MMVREEWVVVARKWCDLIGREAEILEHRLYPADILPNTVAYRVVARKCSADIACNIAEHPCQWAYTAPGFDRFEIS
ncbi:MAG: hypothetical protein AB1791_10065 [Chloroflexota bacterium]